MPAEAKRGRGLPAGARRRRGGQPGNQNARKHGFYCGALALEDMGEFWRILDATSLSPEVAFLFTRLRAALRHDPSSRRVKKDAARLLARWYSARLDLTRADFRVLKKAILEIIENSPAALGREPGMSFPQNESGALCPPEPASGAVPAKRIEADFARFLEQ